MPATASSPIDAPVGQTPVRVGPDLLERFASVLDPRSARGRRHTLASILALAACATAGDAEADYLLTIKANRPALLETAALVLSGPDTGFATFIDTTRGHGRVEQRTVRVCPALEDIGFPHAAQVVRSSAVARHAPRPRGRAKRPFTRSPVGRTRPAAFATAIRGHWEIENKLHWVRDTAFREDENRTRTGTAPRVLASLRNLTISLLRISGTGRIVAALRHNARDHHRPLHSSKSKRKQTRQSRTTQRP